MASTSNKGVKTMPAELAIMRELAYRRMVFLMSQNTDSTEDILPSEVKHSCEVPHSKPLPGPSTRPSSNLSLPGTKQKETTSRADHHPPLQYQQPFYGSFDHKAETKKLYCKISQVKPSCQVSHQMPLSGPSSMPSSSPFLSRAKRKEPTSSPHHPPLQYLQPPPLHGSLHHKEKTKNLDGKLCQVKPSCEVPRSMSLPGPSSRPSSSPFLSATKWKEPTNSAHHPSLQYQQPFHGSLDHKDKTQNLYHEICQVPCSSPFNLEQEEEKVYKLKNGLYNLKQAPRAWYNKIETYFLHKGFEKCSSEHTLFTKSVGGKLLIINLYLDDLIFTVNDVCTCDEFKNSMMMEFDMSDLGRMKHFLGIEVLQNPNSIFIYQRRYAQEVLTKFKMASCNAVKNPIVVGTKLTKDEGGIEVDATLFKQIVGSLIYLTMTRPDLMYVVSLISRYMSRPTVSHWLSAKRTLRYLKGTTGLGIFYKKGEGNVKLLAFTDSGYTGDLDDRRSTSGYVFKIGHGAVSWSSKKQPVVTLSTTEAEYIAAALCHVSVYGCRKF